MMISVLVITAVELAAVASTSFGRCWWVPFFLLCLKRFSNRGSNCVVCGHSPFRDYLPWTFSSRANKPKSTGWTFHRISLCCFYLYDSQKRNVFTLSFHKLLSCQFLQYIHLSVCTFYSQTQHFRKMFQHSISKHTYLTEIQSVLLSLSVTVLSWLGI